MKMYYGNIVYGVKYVFNSHTYLLASSDRNNGLKHA